MLGNASQIGQLRPATAGAPQQVFTASLNTEITLVVVCNTTGSAVNFSLFHDDDGTTFDETTALFFDKEVPANESFIRELSSEGAGVSVAPGGSMAVESSIANALTFSIYGITTTITGD